jgi:hypothetical protein
MRFADAIRSGNPNRLWHELVTTYGDRQRQNPVFVLEDVVQRKTESVTSYVYAFQRMRMNETSNALPEEHLVPLLLRNAIAVYPFKEFETRRRAGQVMTWDEAIERLPIRERARSGGQPPDTSRQIAFVQRGRDMDRRGNSASSRHSKRSAGAAHRRMDQPSRSASGSKKKCNA